MFKLLPGSTGRCYGGTRILNTAELGLSDNIHTKYRSLEFKASDCMKRSFLYMAVQKENVEDDGTVLVGQHLK